ncbi:hypothetical protein [Inquilinus limosus]|uniref:hypothetical protein n=1 Tax=Inquilinus limosus TaxID=171674 RepID=UPI001269A2DA|nr:hypothetical protein [Inquilinus limosus]
MFSFLRRRDGQHRPDGAEALLRMTPRELADLPFWAEPPQPDCTDGAPAPHPLTARTAPRRLPA